MPQSKFLQKKDAEREAKIQEQLTLFGNAFVNIKTGEVYHTPDIVMHKGDNTTLSTLEKTECTRNAFKS